MFDDKPINTGAGNVPGNLPVGEPEDIFSGTEKEGNATPADLPDSKPVPDPEKPNSALGAGVLKPKMETAPVAGPEMKKEPTPAPAPAPAKDMQTPSPTPQSLKPTSSPTTEPAAPAVNGSQQMYKVKEPVLSKGLMAIIITVVVLIIIGGGGWMIYVKFISQPDTDDIFGTDIETDTQIPVEDVFESQVTEPEEDLEPNQDDLTEEGEEIIDDEVLFGEPVDTDNDRLDDQREMDIGTDPRKWDTDSDGMGDGDEVIVWNTDPLNPDTDGDGYLDGDEVKAGYNPLGEGELFEVPEN